MLNKSRKGYNIYNIIAKIRNTRYHKYLYERYYNLFKIVTILFIYNRYKNLQITFFWILERT